VNLNQRTLPFVEYLLSKGADPNLADIEGRTPLHHLAFTNVKQNAIPWQESNRPGFNRQQYIKEKIQVQLQIAEVLLKKGASISIEDS